MPIYEYQCQACGHRLEKIQKMSDDPLKDCPECGKASLTKLVSAPAFRLKGDGWYETDFKTGAKKNALHTSDSSSSPSSASSSDSSSTKTEKSTSDSKSGKKETKSSSSDS